MTRLQGKNKIKPDIPPGFFTILCESKIKSHSTIALILGSLIDIRENAFMGQQSQ